MVEEEHDRPRLGIENLSPLQVERQLVKDRRGVPREGHFDKEHACRVGEGQRQGSTPRPHRRKARLQRSELADLTARECEVHDLHLTRSRLPRDWAVEPPEDPRP